ncbi:MAG TPA: cellulase family glycosylhydrolase [Opitutaceae bacterium]|nr:cellulase family glycosylhydrolase [Opitutaceae bacterium]
MFAPRKLLTLAGALLSALLITSSPAAVKSEMQTYVEAMQPGWNLGNSFDAPGSETGWGNPVVTQEFIQQIAAQGFKSIRIPVSWSDHTGAAPTYTVDTAWLDRVEQVVNWSLDAGLHVMLNMHHDSYWIREMPADYIARYTAVWQQIAPRFRDHPRELMLETINEPDFLNVDDATKITLVNELNTIAYDVIRGTGGGNATRPIVMPTVVTNASQMFLDGLKAKMVELNDSNLIATIHFYGYWPFSTNIAGVTTVDASVLNDINTSLNGAYDTFVAAGIPVVVGELGLLAYDADINAIERGELLKFFEIFTATAQSKGITWQWWDNGKFINRATYQWRDPELYGYLMRSVAGRTTTGSTDLVFLKKGLPVQDTVVQLNLNGNTFVSLKDGATTLQSGLDYTLSGEKLTLKARALSKYATGSFGEKAVFTVNMTSGLPWKLHVRYVDTPVASSVDTETGADIPVPLAFNGDLLKTVEAKYSDGTGIEPHAWTSFKQWRDTYTPDYANNQITFKKALFDKAKPGLLNFAFYFWSGKVVRYQMSIVDRAGQVGTELQIYGDGLAAGWNDWTSWATHDLASTDQAHSGTRSISVTPGAYGAVGLSNGGAAIDTSIYHTLVFWIHGGSVGGQSIGVGAVRGDDWSSPWTGIPAPVANTWQKVEVSLRSLGVDGSSNISRVLFQDWSGGDAPTFYIDDIVLTTAKASTSMDVYADPAVNMTPQVQITKGGYVLNRRTNRYVQTVVVKNTGSTPVTGPVYLVLDSLSANTTLSNSSGKTNVELPTGSPYVQVTSGALAANTQVSVSLEFTVPASGGITYDARLLTDGATP